MTIVSRWDLADLPNYHTLCSKRARRHLLGAMSVFNLHKFLNKLTKCALELSGEGGGLASQPYYMGYT